MHLSADQVYAFPKEDDYPVTVGFRDSAADYCLVLSRFSDLEPDDGTVSVLVRDQIHAQTASLDVHLQRSQCRVRLDEPTALKLLGVREYVVEFETDETTYELLVQLLRIIFQGIPGLTIAESREPA
jgi:hypothetical protein